MAVVVQKEGQLSPFLPGSQRASSASLMLGAPNNVPMETSTLSRSQEPDLTSLSWLHKPDVLNAVCAPLIHVTGEDRGQVKSKRAGYERSSSSLKIRDTDKVLDVILNVRVPRVSAPDVNKPQLSFACMIFMAIESSPSRMLPVRDIYSWIMHKFPFYKGAQSGWKNSVRHNLSLNKCFCKVEKSKLPRGMYMPKGSYWTVDRRYRQSLLAALKRTPFHPYHKYFPLSLLEDKSPGLEEDTAEMMCSLNQPPVTPVTLHAIEVDHSYAQPVRSLARSTAVDIAEEAAIAHVEAELKRLEDTSAESDQAYESSEDMELVEELAGPVQSSLNDSGYSEPGSTMGDLDGANALLHLANSPVVTPSKFTRNKRRSRR